MATIQHYNETHVEDLLVLTARGMSVSQAAKELGMSRATAYRLLGQYRARQGWATR